MFDNPGGQKKLRWDIARQTHVRKQIVQAENELMMLNGWLKEIQRKNRGVNQSPCKGMLQYILIRQ